MRFCAGGDSMTVVQNFDSFFISCPPKKSYLGPHDTTWSVMSEGLGFAAAVRPGAPVA